MSLRSRLFVCLLRRLRLFVGLGRFQVGEPLAQGHDQQREGDRRDFMEPVCLAIHPCTDRWIGHGHFTGHPAEYAAADEDDYRITVHELEYESAAIDDQRNADRKAEYEEDEVALRSGRDADHVVEAHDEVRHDDGLNCCPQLGVSVQFLLLFVRYQHLDADINEQYRPYQLEPGQRQQHYGEKREN